MLAGGRVTIVTDQGPLEVDDADMLPPGMYSVRAISLAGVEKLDPALLARLRELPALETLSLADSPLDDEGLLQLAGCKSLRELTLSGTKITSDGIASLAKLPSLTRLYLARTEIGEAGVRQTCSLPKLTHLSLAQVALTDADLPLCKRLKELVWLDLSGTGVSDASPYAPRGAVRFDAAGRPRHKADRCRTGRTQIGPWRLAAKLAAMPPIRSELPPAG